MEKLQHKPERVALLLITTNIFLLLNSDIHLPALPFLQKDLGTTEFKAQLVLIIFMVGAVFSRLVWGPVSDKFGRRKILLVTIGFQAITQLGLSLAPTIDWLLFWRAVQSFGAGVITVLGTAVITDLFRGDRRARFLGLNEMTFPIAFVIAPVIGAYLFDITQTWRTAFVFIFFIQVACWTTFYLFLPETHKPDHGVMLKDSFKLYFRVIKDRQFMLYNLISGIMIGSGMMFFTISPFIYMVNLGVSINDYAFFQFAPMLVSIFAALIYRYIVEHFGSEVLSKISIKLLYILIPIYLIMGFNLVDITPYTVLCTICVQSAIVPFFVPGIISKTTELYPNLRGMASSASASVRSFCAAGAMFFGSYYIGSDVAALFKTMCGFILLVLFFFWIVTAKKIKPIK